jgi:site-specific DNA recombinase
MTLTNNSLRAAFYARVSSEQQADNNTIASQVAELRQGIAADGCTLHEDACFCDDGVSGTTLMRPALERLRDQVAAGAIDRLYVLAPDRLARKASYQALLIDEFRHAGVEVVFLNHALGKSPEDDLLLQVQGVIAEYERAKILERSRRGKLHAAREGRVSVLTAAPLGYRYVSVAEGGGQARYDVVPEQARLVQQLFSWVGQERLSIHQVCRRLREQGIPTSTGLPYWRPGTLARLLQNKAYLGQAGYGKTRTEPRRARLRPRRGTPETPRHPYSRTSQDVDPIGIPVPALISAELFAAVDEQLQENRRRSRQNRRGASFLLQGLLVCRYCGYALCGQPHYTKKSPKGQGRPTGTYRCTGRMMSKRAWQEKPLCAAKAIGTARLDEAVWQDVCQLLKEPSKLEAEYERRLQGSPEQTLRSQDLGSRIVQVKRGIGRLIEAYRDGLLEKEEFEPQMRQSKERLGRLEREQKELAQEELQRTELRLVIGELEEFSRRMNQGLEESDWLIRREIIRALVKQIEVSDEQVHIIYRVNTAPFVDAPDGGILQHCRRGVWGIVPIRIKLRRYYFRFFLLLLLLLLADEVRGEQQLVCRGSPAALLDAAALLQPLLEPLQYPHDFLHNVQQQRQQRHLSSHTPYRLGVTVHQARPAAAHQQPLLHDLADHLRIKFTQHALRSFPTQSLQTTMALPQLEQQFDLPPRTCQHPQFLPA